jgi:hypothetical protein
MATTETQLLTDGTLLLSNTLDERLPAVTDGLVSHYPFDGNGGAVDIINGAGTTQNVESGTNILDTLVKSWRDPSNWSGGGTIEWDASEDALKFGTSAWNVLEVFIPIDTSKHWYIEAILKQGTSATGIMYLGTKSYDVNKSVVPGHPGTYDYFGKAGGTVPTTWTVYNNEQIGGVNGTGRTGENTTTGDYSSWHTGTKYTKILIISNYNAGVGPTWLKSLKLYTNDTDTSNTVFEEDGIAVQKATNNHFASVGNPTDILDWGFTGKDCTLSTDNIASPVGNSPMKMVPTGPDSYTNTYSNALWNIASAVSGETWTISCWVKTSQLNQPSDSNNDHTLVIFLMEANASGGYLTSSNKSFSVGTEWTKISLTRTLNNASTANIQMRMDGRNTITTGDVIWWDGLQVVKEPFAPATVYSNQSAGQVSIPNPVKTGEYTISFKCKLLPVVGMTSSYATVMCMGNYNSTNSWTIMDYNGSTFAGNMRLIRKTAADGWAWGNGYFSTASNLGEFVTYTLVRNSTNYRAYQNGVYQGQIAHASTTMQDLIWVGSRNVGSAVQSSIIKDLSIYNRALSDTEVAKNSNSGLSIQLDTAIVGTLQEKAFHNDETWYYPLSNDTDDINKHFTASDSTNIAHEDSSAWVGTSTQNLSYYSDTFVVGTNVNTNGTWLYSSGTVNSTNNASPTGRYNAYNIQLHNVSWDLYRQYLGLVNGTSYTFSVYVKLGTATNFCITPNDSTAWNTLTGATVFTSADGLSTDRWTRVSVTFTANTSLKANMHLGGHSETMTQQTAGSVFLSDHQLEAHSYRTPHIRNATTPSTRSTSALEFNFNSSIGLDWNSNWSICYWKKPIATDTNTLIGYSIESLGSNGNSVGGGYVWLGRESTFDKLQLSVPTDFDPNNYFEKWQHISLVKSGTTVTITTRGIKGNTNSVRTYTLSGVVSNYYVNQYGYDFKFGWDDVNICNAFYKDLVVAKRAFTQTELDSIYSQQKIFIDKMIVNNIVEQGI